MKLLGVTLFQIGSTGVRTALPLYKEIMMATIADAKKLKTEHARIQSPRVSTNRFNWTAALLSSWMIGGLYLDGWAHEHGRVDNTFFTPWHAVLYSGVFALLIFFLIYQWRNMTRGSEWRSALPEGYLLSLGGAILFLLGGGLDLLWHTLFGIEVDLETLLSPTHLLLASSGVLMVSGPIRALWPRLRSGEPRVWRVFGPLMISMTLVLSILTFFTQFAHPFHETYAASGVTNMDPHADIYIMKADGSAQTRLTVNTVRGGWGAAWSPDGRKIAFTSSETDPNAPSELYLMNRDGSDWTQLTHNGRTNYLPSWSPDGMKIAFISQVGNQLNTADIHVIQADGSRELQLTNDVSQEYGISWSPDGKQIVFGSLRDGTWQIYKMQADGSQQTPLIASGGGNSPAWSPDGSRIAFTSDRYGSDEIFVMDSDGSHLLRLTDNISNDGNPAWSPDSSKLIFSSNRDGNGNIYVMNSDGSNATNLSQDSTLWNGIPAWSPDGKQILYTTQGQSSHTEGYTQSLGISSVLLQTALLMGVVLLLVWHSKLPFGALTLIIGLNSALMTVFHDKYALLPAVLLTGIFADLLLRWLRPSNERRKPFALFAFLVPVILYSLYYLTLQVTQGITWTIHLWLGSIFLAGAVGLLVSFLLLFPLSNEWSR